MGHESGLVDIQRLRVVRDPKLLDRNCLNPDSPLRHDTCTGDGGSLCLGALNFGDLNGGVAEECLQLVLVQPRVVLDAALWRVVEEYL